MSVLARRWADDSLWRSSSYMRSCNGAFARLVWPTSPKPRRMRRSEREAGCVARLRPRDTSSRVSSGARPGLRSLHCVLRCARPRNFGSAGGNCDSVNSRRGSRTGLPGRRCVARICHPRMAHSRSSSVTGWLSECYSRGPCRERRSGPSHRVICVRRWFRDGTASRLIELPVYAGGLETATTRACETSVE